MFYEPKKKDHGLPKNPFNSLVIPQAYRLDFIGRLRWLWPIWRLTVFFNAICYRPPTVMFASGAGTADDGNKGFTA